MRYKALAVLAAVSTLSGCMLFDNDPDDEFEERQHAWQALAISDYTYDFVRSCFCGGPAGRTLRIVVRANAVVSVTDVQTGKPPEFLSATWAVTIDELFRQLRGELDRGVDKIDFDFDARFHFPLHVTMDRI